MAFGAHGKTQSEAVQDDTGWTSFESREVESKTEFHERLTVMGETWWEGNVCKYMYVKSTNKRGTLRSRKLRSQYLNKGGGTGWRVKVKKAVKE